MALADRVTVLRDGRHVLTRADRPSSTEDRIIAAMVGRSLLDVPREARRPGGEPVLSVSRPVARRARPQRLAPGAATASASSSPPARSSASAGCSAPGRTEILETHLRLGRGAPRRRGPARRRGRRHPLAARGAPPRPGAGHRGPQDARACTCDASIGDNVALPLVGRLARFGVRSFAGEAALARARGGGARRALRQHRAAGRHAVGRQPAEGGDRQVAGDAAARAAARRADARHRRRRQARDLRPGLRAGRARGWRSSWSARRCRSCCCSPTASWSCRRAGRRACCRAPRRARSAIMQLAAPRRRHAARRAA